jgi:hypothetical protein
MGKTIPAFLGITLIATMSFGKSYHVATTGIDTDIGTPAFPYRTIKKAATVMQAGDTCYIHAGTYYENVKPASSGTAGKPIVFTRYQNDEVVVHGGKVISGWTQFKGNIYQTQVSEQVKDLFVNRQFMLLARHPNMPYDPVKGYDMCRPTLGTANPPAGIDWTGVTVVQAKDKEGWWNSLTTQNSYQQLTDSLVGGGWLMGVPGLIDSEREWCWKAGVLYLYAPGGQNPANLLVEAKLRDCAFDLSNISYVNLEKITVFGSTVNMNGATHCIMDGCKAFYVSSIFNTSTFNTKSGDLFSPLSADLSGKGILVGGSENTIQNCEIAHSWGSCVSILGSKNTVYNCHIYDANWQGWECAVIAMNGGGHVIRKNTLHDSQRSIVTLSNKYDMAPVAEASLIDSNEMYNAGLEKTDNALFYCFNTNGNGTIISYNWVHDSYNGYSSTLHGNSGIYLDDYSSNFIVHHNVIWNAKTGPWGAGIFANNPQAGGVAPNNHQIYNNTIWDCTRAINSPDKDWNGTIGRPYWSNTKVFNNILLMIETFGPAKIKTNYYEKSPMFADTINHDFRLKAGSPCIDAGTIIPGITHGFKGSAPDIGAFEYGGVDWKPGQILPGAFSKDKDR